MAQRKTKDNPLLTEALSCHRRGWSIIPIPAGSKAAQIKWKRYQQQCADQGQIRKWFSGCDKKNIAVVLGPVSGGLCCRDFDDMASYQVWASRHPQLVKTLPIVRTGRGRHVYFSNTDIQSTRHFGDGELRAAGGYCLLPPSIHPDGSEYEWQNEPNGSIPEIDPITAGFIGDVTEHTEQTEADRANTGNEGVSDKIKTIIQQTLPCEIGTRNQKIFLFTRQLKSLPELSESAPQGLIGLVRQWHEQALPNIRTKEFEETWIDFLKAWDKVKFRIGDEPMSQIAKKAFKQAPPDIAVKQYPDNPNIQKLVSLCSQLQASAGREAFFLSCRKAGELLGCNAMQISRWFFLLEADGIVKTVEKGGTAQHPRNATRYKYLGN